jgi:tetratricopeptide (TPR) repeat protein
MIVTPRATVFGYPWMDTLAHEYSHYVVSALSRDSVPVWLQEGLARFQQIRWRGAPQLDLTASDRHLLDGALRKGELIRFEAMHPSMAKLPSQEAAALAFAEVNTFIAFLHQAVGYDGLRAAIAAIGQGKSAKRAVADVAGKSFSQVESEWRTFLDKVSKREPSQAKRVSPKRVRFRKGAGKNDDLLGLDEVANKARKCARLGGMLRARGQAAAAAIEYEKAWELAPNDPFVGAKLARTYVELGRFDRAIELAAPLSAQDSENAALATTLGRAQLASGDAAAAQKALELALRVSPFDPDVRCGLAEVYQKLGKVELANRENRACQIVR